MRGHIGGTRCKQLNGVQPKNVYSILFGTTVAMSKRPKWSSKRVQDPKAYREGLGPQEKGRYFEKLGFIGGADPYQLAPSTWIRDDPVILPSVGYPDIVNYLVFSPNPYTCSSLI